jgi:hypothetical protein
MGNESKKSLLASLSGFLSGWLIFYILPLAHQLLR